MTSMIERVAKGIYEKRNGPGCRAWAHIGKPHQQPYLTDARAAIEALSEPTAEMLAAVYPVLGIPDPPVWANCYRIMMQAALKEQP